MYMRFTDDKGVTNIYLGSLEGRSFSIDGVERDCLVLLDPVGHVILYVVSGLNLN